MGISNKIGEAFIEVKARIDSALGRSLGGVRRELESVGAVADATGRKVQDSANRQTQAFQRAGDAAARMRAGLGGFGQVAGMIPGVGGGLFNMAAGAGVVGGAAAGAAAIVGLEAARQAEIERVRDRARDIAFADMQRAEARTRSVESRILGNESSYNVRDQILRANAERASQGQEEIGTFSYYFRDLLPGTSALLGLGTNEDVQAAANRSRRRAGAVNQRAFQEASQVDAFERVQGAQSALIDSATSGLTTTGGQSPAEALADMARLMRQNNSVLRQILGATNNAGS